MRLRAAAVPLLATFCVASCGDGFSEGCTEIGGASGVIMTLAPDLYREGRTVEVEVCQDGHCDTASTDLYRAEGEVHASVDFPRFASTFEEGTAQLTVTLLDGLRTVKVIESPAQLSFNYPNGRKCDGDDWLHGKVALQ